MGSTIDMTKAQDKELMSLWASIVKAKGKCEVCGKTSYLNAHHFYSRSDHKLRYDLNNGFCVCSGCHSLSSKFSAHLTPADFYEWAVKTRGQKWLKDLQTKHWDNSGYKQTYEQIKKYLTKHQ